MVIYRYKQDNASFTYMYIYVCVHIMYIPMLKLQVHVISEL